MENNRVKLDICGVSIALITEKDESYVRRLADEITAEISPMISSGISKDRAALFAAFNYLDELHEFKSKPHEDNKEEFETLKAESEMLYDEISELEERVRALNERNAELENSLQNNKNESGELAALRKENEALLLKLSESKDKYSKEEEYKKKLDEAMAELETLRHKALNQKEHAPVFSSGELRNPMRPQLEAEGMVDYYAKD